MANNTGYLKKLARHKRIIGAARLAGWVFGYGLGILFLYGIAILGWRLLTGSPPHTFGQGMGLWLIVMVNYVACELFRNRSNE